MQLLFDREQVSGARAPKFKLMAKIELDEMEQKIMAHYRLDKALLIDKFDEELVKRTAILVVVAFLVGLVVFIAMFGWTTGILLAMAAAGGGGWYYWDKNREFIFVSDLLKGRHFKCHSVVELAKKEAFLNNITTVLRQVMESARHWNGTQSHAIPVLPPDEAKQLIIQVG
jgi:hypothetical protein